MNKRGRPKLDKGMKRTEIISAHVLPREREFLKSIAKEYDLSLSEMIRAGLNMLLERGVDEYVREKETWG